MWQDIYLEVDTKGYIIEPDHNLICGKIRLKVKECNKEI